MLLNILSLKLQMVTDDHQIQNRIALVGLVEVLLECSLLVKVHIASDPSSVDTRSSAAAAAVVL